MKLKHAILEAMERDALRAALVRFDLADGVDKRSSVAMRERLRGARRARPEELLAPLRVAEVRRVCELLGVDGGGRKPELRERLLAAGAGPVRKQPASATRTGKKRNGRKRPAAGATAVATKPRREARTSAQTTATTGYETELWAAANTLRGNMDAAEYKHVVLGLIFLKYISDAFEERHAQLVAERDEGADPEEPDEYTGANVFWVPAEARWNALQARAKLPRIGRTVDDAMAAVERDNPSLRGVLPKDYARPALDKRRLGQLIDLFGNINVGDAEARSRDVLGRVYEYFLSAFASAEGKRGGEFYTARCVVRLLVEMIEPYQGRVYDPCCGSSGMFVQSMAFINAHSTGNGNGGKPSPSPSDVAIYGQESNHTTWRLAKMNLAIRGIDASMIAEGDTFHNDRHPDLKADYILANPPFNVSDWGGDQLADDKRWAYGVPPKRNANFAWVQHMVHHLAPGGVAGFVLANGSMSSQAASEGAIRKNLIEADLVDCMIALPGQLFYSTQIPVCLWFLARDRGNGKFRNRRGEVLFIDARNEGHMVDRTHRELSDEDIARIARVYHVWRGKQDRHEDVPGFCKSATLDDIRAHDHILTPGRYVGVAPQPEDDEPFHEKMTRLAAEWHEQRAEARRLDAAIAKNLAALGFGPGAKTRER